MLAVFCGDSTLLSAACLIRRSASGCNRKPSATALAAAAKAVSEGFLLQADADRLIKQAADSNVLSPQNTASTAIGR